MESETKHRIVITPNDNKITTDMTCTCGFQDTAQIADRDALSVATIHILNKHQSGVVNHHGLDIFI